MNGARAIKSEAAWGGSGGSREKALGHRRQSAFCVPHTGAGGEAGDALWTLSPKEKGVSFTKAAVGLPTLDREDTSEGPAFWFSSCSGTSC